MGHHISTSFWLFLLCKSDAIAFGEFYLVIYFPSFFCFDAVFYTTLSYLCSVTVCMIESLSSLCFLPSPLGSPYVYSPTLMADSIPSAPPSQPPSQPPFPSSSPTSPSPSPSPPPSIFPHQLPHIASHSCRPTPSIFPPV